MKLVAYLRVSTALQAEKGLGLEIQEGAIKAWAKGNGHRVVLWTRDAGVSGANGPETRIGLPRLPKTDIVILPPEQVDLLARSVPDSHRVLIYLLAYGGLRWGEAAALRRGRCDLLRSRIEVAESLAEVNGVHHFGTTKTHERRHVRLPAFLVEMLAQHLAKAPADTDALVFTAARGGALRYPNFRRGVWDPAVDQAGLPEGLTTHWLRHTCASILIARGADPVAVQRHLGHKDVSTTLNLYGHLFPDRMEQLAAALEEVYLEAQANGAPPTDPRRVIPLPKPRGRKAV